MIIIPREELNRAALGLNKPREDAGAFGRWLAAASGSKAESSPAPEQVVRPNLYSHRQWRCE